VRVVVLGDAMVDVVAAHGRPLAQDSDTPARVRLRPGGSAANVAAWLARAGAQPALVCRVGEDAMAAVALSGLDGVDVRAARDGVLPTGACVVLVGPEGERTCCPTRARTTASPRRTCPGTSSAPAACCT
jgi:ribokinase